MTKLPIGQMNVLLHKLRAGYAQGVKRPVKLKDRPTDKVKNFNNPKLILRKAA